MTRKTEYSRARLQPVEERKKFIMLIIRGIRMAYKPALKPLCLVKLAAMNPPKKCLQIMPHANQLFTNDSKEPPKIITESLSSGADPKSEEVSAASQVAVSPSASSHAAAAQETISSSTNAQSAGQQKSAAFSSDVYVYAAPDTSGALSSTSEKTDSQSAVSEPFVDATATAGTSSSAGLYSTTSPRVASSSGISSSRYQSSPESLSSSSPFSFENKATENKSSIDSIITSAFKLPNREQVEKYSFRAAVLLWDTSVYLYSLAARLFDEYVFKQPTLQQYWGTFKMKMDKARQEMKSK
ncbi:hypothetical protein GQX74_006754 [Glossina fuscipes]|nr:hypothetical protein GQX74_006754 [Glossina fuscipes]